MSEKGKPPADGLVAWCHAVEGRLVRAQAEKAELSAENERLRGRVAELTALLKGIEQAYLLGKLRAAGMMPQLIPPAGSRGAAPAPAAPARPRAAQPKTEVLDAPAAPPGGEAGAASADGTPAEPGPE